MGSTNMKLLTNVVLAMAHDKKLKRKSVVRKYICENVDKICNGICILALVKSINDSDHRVNWFMEHQDRCNYQFLQLMFE